MDTFGVLLFSSRLLTPKRRLNTNKVFMSLENESGFEQLVLFNFFRIILISFFVCFVKRFSQFSASNL